MNHFYLLKHQSGCESARKSKNLKIYSFLFYGGTEEKFSQRIVLSLKKPGSLREPGLQFQLTKMVPGTFL